MTVYWDANRVLDVTNAVIAEVSKDVAEKVMKDAKAILKRKAKKTTADGLLSQFYIDKSKFKRGGYLVYVQGPKKWWPPYHASFVEMGGYSSVWGAYKRKGAKSLKGISPIYIEPKPFLRPAVNKNRTSAQKQFRDDLEKTYKRDKKDPFAKYFRR